MRNLTKLFFTFITAALVMTASVIVSDAEEEEKAVVSETSMSQFLTATGKVEAKEEPDRNTKTVFTYEAGSTIMVVGETKDGWYKVSFQGKEGYIDMNAQKVKENVQKAEIDVEALDKEMEETAAEGKMIVEETERYRQEAKRSRIWGTIIVLLVVGIFATGIISTLRGEKQRKIKDKETNADHDDVEILDLNQMDESEEPEE